MTPKKGPTSSGVQFEPNIVCFLCKWCAYAGADLAGALRMKYAPNALTIRVMCSSRISPGHILMAFRDGADGVLIGACHPGDCHYRTGNNKTHRRVFLLGRVLDDFGVCSGRLRLEWISASEGRRFADVISDFVREIRELGPLGTGGTTEDGLTEGAASKANWERR